MTGVINDIVLKPHPQIVERKIEDALKRGAEIEAERINVIAGTGGTVTLKGKVRDSEERPAVKNAASSAPNVRHVEDRLTIG